MALFSDIDWVILLAAAAFLLLGKENAQVLRTIGRWYGRAGALKQELLAEFSKAADLPTIPSGGPLTIRGALLGLDPTPTHRSGIPTAVTAPPMTPARPIEPAWGPWTGGYPMPTWSMTVPAVPVDAEVRR
ncbi:MAG TPA: hypothetical protein VMC82_03640 [Thermoplasmata archaeon]|nr:hypothetical protein [Thermoplasmata archaeon]